MRKFSEFEKRVLKLIVIDNPESYSRQSFSTLIANIFYGNGVEFVFVKGSSTKLIVKVETDSPKRHMDANVFASQLIELMVLFEYLTNNYLIRLYNMGSGGINTTQQKNYSTPPITQTIDDAVVFDFYKNYWNSFFYCSDELRHIVNDNNFLTDEQINIQKQINTAHDQLDEAKKQTKRAGYSVLIALFALLASIIAIIISINNK